ncbi:MAG: acyltransferase [Betaproteobacteria bacterium]
MQTDNHLKVLDGWRGLSIVLVLVAHLVPLGEKTVALFARPFNSIAPAYFAIDPPAWRINDAIGMLGMVVFFNLSGFLITSFLLRERATVAAFLIRRLCRILPLAWLYLAVVLAFTDATIAQWAANWFFYANLPPTHLVPLTDHFWSLCVEMQFYVGVAILFSVSRKYGLFALLFLCVFFTLFRVYHVVAVSSVTYFRIDEILAGCVLALIFHGRFGQAGEWALHKIRAVPQWSLLLVLIASCFHQAGWLNYLRPYLAAALIGATLLTPQTRLAKGLQVRVLIYLAAVSYALYVVHIGLTGTWLGSGEYPEKHLKRPLLLVVLFVLAHCSTYYYEQRWIAFGKRLSERIERKRAVSPQ